ncbi:hypothetical protein M9H77_26691 [Catharanthus roseus]|uniref:Uncharacterized protein n=1 Tax=Catharanthus roseus TaxID=4058 RepID=A0ACC0AAE4_CATRO|nr:hypothetical protein M9H77_26691 [Catharanthus roseus]
MRDDGRKILVYFMKHVCVEFPTKLSSLKCSMSSSLIDFSTIIFREALSASHSRAVSKRRSGKERTLGVGLEEVPSTLALFYLDFEEEATALLEAIGRIETKRKIGKMRGKKQHQKAATQTIIRTQNAQQSKYYCRPCV